MTDTGRGTGRTTQQLKNLPKRACFFVSDHREYEYANRLAKQIGRSDVFITYPDRLESIRGREFSVVEFDHDFRASQDMQWRIGAQVLPYVRLKPEPFEWPAPKEGYWNTEVDVGGGP